MASGKQRPPPNDNKREARAPERVPITRARQELCPLVKTLSSQADGVVGIMVGEEVGAYLVSPAKLRALEEAEARTRGPAIRRPSIAGTIELLVDDVHAALREVRQQAEAEVLAKADRYGSDPDGR